MTWGKSHLTSLGFTSVEEWGHGHIYDGGGQLFCSSEIMGQSASGIEGLRKVGGLMVRPLESCPYLGAA